MLGFMHKCLVINMSFDNGQNLSAHQATLSFGARHVAHFFFISPNLNLQFFLLIFFCPSNPKLHFHDCLSSSSPTNFHSFSAFILFFFWLHLFLAHNPMALLFFFTMNLQIEKKKKITLAVHTLQIQRFNWVRSSSMEVMSWFKHAINLD